MNELIILAIIINVLWIAGVTAYPIAYIIYKLFGGKHNFIWYCRHWHF